MSCIKKKAISYLLIFCIIFAGIGINTDTADAAVKLTDSIKTKYWWGEAKHEINILQVNGKHAYCLEPLKMITTREGYKEVKYKFTKSQWEKLVLISHFGYNTGYKTKADYAAAQVMMWREILKWDGEKVDSLSKTNIPDLSKRVKAIDDRINDYKNMIKTKPSFDGKSNIKVTAGKKYILKDSNKVLGKYPYKIAKKPEGVEVKIDKESHSLVINADNLKGVGGQIELVIKENNPVSKNRFYYHKSSQNLGNIGFLSDLKVAADIDIENTGLLKLLKKSTSGEPVSGVVFNIKSVDGTRSFDKTTDASGQINVSDIPVGEYIVTEVSVPEPYLLDTTSKKVTIETGKTAEVSFTNDVPKGKVILLKFDENGYKLKDAEYRFWKVSSNAQDQGKVYKTDDNGKIEISDLSLGSYKYQEVKAPYGYVRDPKIYSFDISYKDDKTPVIAISMDHKNFKAKGEFELVKRSEKGNMPLKDAQFRIWSDNGFDKTMKTDENGKIVLENLDFGEYSYQEIEAPFGYVRDENIYKFNITYKDDVTPVISVSKERINKEAKGRFELVKFNDDKSQKLKDAVYRIWSVADKDHKEGEIFDKIVKTDENGKIIIDDLEFGKYYYQEVKAPFGYIRDKEKYEFELNYENDLTPVVSVGREQTNKEAKGRFELVKYNSDKSKTLEGAQYHIWSAETEDHKAGEILNKTVETNQEGKFVLEDLHFGKYYYQEVKAPYGYLVDDGIYEFEIAYINDEIAVINQTREATNSEPTGEISLIKTFAKQDDITVKDRKNITLKGAEYQLWAKEDIKNEAGNKTYFKAEEKVGLFVTNEKGITNKIENLPLGKYMIKETKAPDGCYIDPTIYEVELSYKDQNTKVISKVLDVEDKVIPPPTTKTNDDTPIGAILILMFMGLCGTVAFAIKKD